jgi:hypothetical protein
MKLSEKLDKKYVARGMKKAVCHLRHYSSISWKHWRRAWNMIIGVAAEVWNEHLPGISQKRYALASLVGIIIEIQGELLGAFTSQLMRAFFSGAFT